MNERKVSKSLLRFCNFFVLLVLFISLAPSRVNAEYPKPVKMRCTCYTASEGSVTASGQTVREGIVAAKREWIGCVAVIYDIDMNFIGYFEVLDTGNGMDTDGDGKGDSIKNGKSIDVYRDTYDRCVDWISEYGDYVYVQIVKAEG